MCVKPLIHPLHDTHAWSEPATHVAQLSLNLKSPHSIDSYGLSYSYSLLKFWPYLFNSTNVYKNIGLKCEVWKTLGSTHVVQI